MPVRSFIITPDGSSKIPLEMPVTVHGITFSGFGRVVKVEFSADDGKTWNKAKLGKDYGRYSFRTWEITWIPKCTGRYVLAVRPMKKVISSLTKGSGTQKATSGIRLSDKK